MAKEGSEIFEQLKNKIGDLFPKRATTSEDDTGTPLTLEFYYRWPDKMQASFYNTLEVEVILKGKEIVRMGLRFYHADPNSFVDSPKDLGKYREVHVSFPRSESWPYVGIPFAVFKRMIRCVLENAENIGIEVVSSYALHGSAVHDYLKKWDSKNQEFNLQRGDTS